MNISADDSFLVEYRERAKIGEIIIGQELKMELDRLIEDIRSDRYIFDRSDALLRMDFLSNCVRLTKSPFYNKPMVLMLWQRAFIESLFSFKMPETGFDRFKKALLLIARKNTKALALDTRIPTPEGDKTMRDIREGDYVFDENGKPVRVLHTSEIFNDRVCYEITFEDGDRIVCDENHLWTVQTKGSRRRQQYVPKSDRKSRCEHSIDDKACLTVRTYEMVNDFKHIRGDGKGVEYKYRVPVPGALEYPAKELFSPYLLGLWLGDGDKNDNRLAVGAEDLDTLLSELERERIPISSVKMFSGKYEVRLGEYYLFEGKHHNTIREELRKIGVWKNKHIPERYLQGSVEQRVALLQGLMDTDGTVSKAGQCSFSQKSERMTQDMSRLLSSLGIKHTISPKVVHCNGKLCHAYWIQFWADKLNPCFRYERKRSRLKDRLAPRMGYKSIVDIRRVPNRDTKCITVNSSRGLFLCGERNTVTHNSETSSGLALSEFIVGKPGSDIVASSNDDAQASIVYDAIDTMRMLIDPRQQDTRRNQRYISNMSNGSKIFKLSDRTRNKEGRNIDFAVLDETHEMKDNVIAKSIEQSQSLKDSPKLIEITTEGFVLDGFLDSELKYARAIIYGEKNDEASERWLPWLYTQDSEQEVWNGNRENRLWMKSNPTLGVIKKWDYLEEQVALARESKADRIFVLSKDFNIKQNASEAWLNLEDYTYDSAYDIASFKGAKCLGAVDLAETTDLASAKILMMRSDDDHKYILSHYFIPESKLDEDKSSGAKYKEWAQDGLLTVCEGNEVDLAEVADWFYSLYTEHNIRLWRCGYDQRFAKDWIKRMEYYGWSKTGGDDSDLIMILQNAQTLNSAIKLCEADFKHQVLMYNNNDMDRWCLGNSGIKIDDKGMALIVKQEPGKKIDGAVCLAILQETYRRNKTEYLSMIGG